MSALQGKGKRAAVGHAGCLFCVNLCFEAVMALDNSTSIMLILPVLLFHYCPFFYAPASKEGNGSATTTLC